MVIYSTSILAASFIALLNQLELKPCWSVPTWNRFVELTETIYE